MEKWMIVYVLPLEVWMDIFCFPWISREKFGQFVDRIGNFKFAEHAQFYLHEWGRRKICEVLFLQNGFIKYEHRERFCLDVPRTPLPENIKAFDRIVIRLFDSKTIQFLGMIQPLLTHPEIDVSSQISTPELRTILTEMAPFLRGIHSLCCIEQTFPAVRQFLLPQQLANVKVLKIDIHLGKEMPEENFDFIANWLTQNDGPRLCELKRYGGDFEHLVQAVRQQFLAAKTHSIFGVILEVCDLEEEQFAEFQLANNIGEQLHGKWIGPSLNGYEKRFQITRHRTNCDTKEVLDWIKAMTEDKIRGQIQIYYPTILVHLMLPRSVPWMGNKKFSSNNRAHQKTLKK